MIVRYILSSLTLLPLWAVSSVVASSENVRQIAIIGEWSHIFICLPCKHSLHTCGCIKYAFNVAAPIVHHFSSP